ncbi:MAG: SpoIIE family protein phosphatase [Phycisphaerae bacterium]|nr:SpoIIE family protein phosphatase [Phycisphaerae bacterium]
MPNLIVTFPDGRTQAYNMRKPELLIGRDSGCDLSLPDDTITSRQHAKILLRADNSLWIHDLKSKNGTTVNERAIAAAPLHPGDRIRIGTYVITLAAEAHRPEAQVDTPTDLTTGVTSGWRAEPHSELSQRRLKTLYELNERLAGRFDRDDLLRELLNVCTEQLRFERAGIALWNASSKHLNWIELNNVGHGGPAGEFLISRSIVDRCVNDAERILINDTSSSDVDPTQSMISNNIRSAMCVPMVYLQEVHGVIYGDRVTTSGGYRKEDIDFFGALGRLGAMGLANVQLVEEIKRRDYVDAQLRTARQIQVELFPGEPLQTDSVRIDALNDPGQKVSGDYYDYFVRDDGLIVAVIADVAGKGLPASLLTANIQAAVRLILDSQTDIAAAMRQLNKLAIRNMHESRFITGIFGLLDPKRREFTFCNAGHPPPYLIEARSTMRKLEFEPDLPLGIEENDLCYHARTITLPASTSSILMFTDGVPDAEDEHGEQFGEGRLVATLNANLAQPSHELVTRVRRSIKQFTRNQPLTDDVTLLAIELS